MNQSLLHDATQTQMASLPVTPSWIWSASTSASQAENKIYDSWIIRQSSGDVFKCWLKPGSVFESACRGLSALWNIRHSAEEELWAHATRITTNTTPPPLAPHQGVCCPFQGLLIHTRGCEEIWEHTEGQAHTALTSHHFYHAYNLTVRR